MPDSPAPAIQKAVSGSAGKLTKFPPWVYVIIASGVVVAVIYMRRQQEPATVPSTDPTAYVPTPDAAVGSYQGYDTPTDTNLTGRDLLEFIVTIREQNLALTPVPEPAPVAPSTPTGGGLPNVVIPNPPPPATSAPAPTAPAPSPVNTVQPSPDPCVGKYPHQSQYGCYQVVCASGKGKKRAGRWHVYNPKKDKGNGREVWVGTSC